jgi:threonine/homoserine/homoserine lactone efflux protein
MIALMQGELGALALFAFVTSVTPGPNNVMLTASGVNFGFRRSIPHILGITFGFPAMLVAVGLGAAGVLQASPTLHTVLKWCGAAYLLWLAWAIAHATPAQAERGASQSGPMSFFGAALFQWVNPKAWVMLAGALPTFTTVGGTLWQEIALMAAAFALACLPSCALWCGFGVAIGRLLGSPHALRGFNMAMAALLALSVLTLFV